jgi:hypothetical protein
VPHHAKQFPVQLAENKEKRHRQGDAQILSPKNNALRSGSGHSASATACGSNEGNRKKLVRGSFEARPETLRFGNAQDETDAAPH